MMKYLFAAVFLASLTLGAGKLPVFNYTFSAKTMTDTRNPGINADPGFRKLTDGKINKDGSKVHYGRVVFRHIENGEKPVVITFNFRAPVKLSEARVHYFRGPRSYGINAIRLMGVKGDGSRLPLGSVSLKHPYTKPKTDPFNMACVIKSDDDTPVRSIEMTFIRAGGFLGLNEIEFFGTQLKSEKPAFAANPLDKFAADARPGLRLYQADGQYVLENDQMIYGIDPRYSGAVNYAYDKAAKRNLIMYSAPGSGYGPFFNDRFYPGSYAVRDMYRYVTYKADVISDTPEQKQIRMTGTGKSGVYANVKIEKLYTLEKNSARLRVDYTITNGLDNVVPLNKGFWMYGGVQAVDGYRRILPGMNGVESTSASGQLATRDVSAGWYGIEAGSHGIAFLLPWERLQGIYFWAGNEYSGTAECKLGVYPIQPGGSLAFTMGLAPFDKIGTPDMVNEFAAGSFGLAPEYVTVPAELSFKLRAMAPGEYTVRISGGLLRNGKVAFKNIAAGKISGLRGTVKFKPLKGRGTFVYRADVLLKGKNIFTAEAAAAFGGATSGLYTQRLPGEKIKDSSPDNAKLNLNFNSTALATPHIKWAKPYAGGKIKVLAINTSTGGIRDMIEMAQRFDMDLTTNFIGGLWSLSGHAMSLSVKSCLNILAEQLKKEYDLYVISSDSWGILGKDIANILLEKVEKGAGMILMEPTRFPAQFSKFIHPDKRGVTRNAEKWSGDFKGVSSRLLPDTRIRRYARLGSVTAKAGSFPLSGVFQYGKGRVCVLSYLVTNPRYHGAKYSMRPNFFLPQMSYGPASAIPQFDGHEYQMAYLGKLFYEYAGKISPVSAGQVTLHPGTAVLELNALKNMSVEITLTLRDKFSAPVKQLKVKKSLKQGKNSLTISLPVCSLAGLHIADVTVSGKGGTLWWGAGAFENPATAKITAVKVPVKIFKKSEKLPVEVLFTGKAQVQTSLFDSEGNEVSRASGAKTAIALADCRTPVAFLQVELHQKGRVLDKSKVRIELYQPPVAERMNIALGWPGVGSKSQLAFMPLYLEQMKRMGVNCTSGSGPSQDVMNVERKIRDSGITYLSTEIYLASPGIGGKSPFNTRQKPKDKFDLIRKPCLSAPGYKAGLGKVRGKGFNFNYGSLIIPGSDEANMFSEWDGCFSKHCQKEFRNWLKKVYPSLEALNRSWDCNFKSWDEVIALTASEVRQKKSFAGWVDHRTFNDWNRADAFRIMTTAMTKASGGLHLSLSGTSETNPWNAWDYYLLMPWLKTLASYSGEQTIQHRSFAPHRLTSMPWIGYDASGDRTHQQVLHNLMNGSTGFNIYGNLNIQPDFRHSPKAEELIKVLDLYRNGPGEAIMRMGFKSYPVAFLYSPASIKVNWITGFSNQRTASTCGFSQIVKDAGLAYDYVAYGQLEKSGVPAKYKVLFLPVSCALSDKEVSALEKFVKNGGTLVADFRAGTFDNHGTPRVTPALSKLFGINSDGKVVRESSIITGTGALKGLKIKADHFELGLKAVTAKVLGTVNGKPVIFENSYGKGKAIYFGASAIVTFGDWKEMRYSKNNAPSTKVFNNFFGAIFKKYGMIPVATAPTLQGTTLILREAGPAMILATVRDISQTALLGKDAVKHRIALNKKYHIYDLINHKYLGYGNSFVYEYTPVTQGVFVLLPYKGKEIKVKFTATGAELELLADTQKFADHTFHVELLDGSGKPVPAFNDVVLGKGNKGFYKFRKPLNAKGKWKLQVREILTGLTRSDELP